MPTPTAATPSPNGQCRYDRRLAEILAHATRVFGEKGYDAASIRDIARASRTSLAGLYYYFRSKEHLLYLIQKDAFETLLAGLEERLAGVEDPVERLRCLVANHMAYFGEHPKKMKVLAHESESLSGPHQKEIARLKRAYYHRALELFEEVQRARPSRARNPRLAVLSLFGMMNWVYTWHNPEVDPAVVALGDQMADLFLNGVLEKENRDARHRTGRNGKTAGQLPRGTGRRGAGARRPARQHLYL